jgi:hypothetical protein
MGSFGNILLKEVGGIVGQSILTKHQYRNLMSIVRHWQCVVRYNSLRNVSDYIEGPEWL